MCDREPGRRIKGADRRPGATLLIVVALLASGRTASAQGSLPAELRDGSAAVMRSADEGGLRAAVRREAIRLARDSAPAAGQSDGWIARHPVLVGTLIGTGVGAVLSQVDSVGGANHDPRVALIGAGAGAWGGLIASAVHKSGKGQKVGKGTKIGIAAGAVALVVLPLLASYSAGA